MEGITKKQAALSLLVLILIIGYRPPEQALQTAIIQIQAANATFTSTPEPTSTPAPTQTPNPSPSPTPDVRIIKTDAHLFLLRIADLPPEGKYYLPKSHWISHHDNSVIIQQMGVESGREYINSTGRIDGWFVYYKRGNKNKPIPEEIYDNVIVFKSVDGARLAVEQYGEKSNLQYGLTKIDTDLAIGDSTRVYESKRNGLTDYLIEFSYRNYVHRVDGYGLEADVDRKLMEDVARLLLGRLQSAISSIP